MAAYMVVMGPCVICRQVFSFSPSRVPSVRVQGELEPVCEHCMTLANTIRLEKGLEALPILPGAYEPDEAI
jgi:hypothetical protein